MEAANDRSLRILKKGAEQMPFPREEVEAAVLQYIQDMENVSKPGGDIVAVFDRMFTDDVVYVEHEFGTVRGRKAVVEWCAALVNSNPAMSDIVLRFDWYMIDGNRVVVYHHDGFPDPRGNGAFEVTIVTILEYAGNMRWSYEEDIYNAKEFEQALSSYTAVKAEVAAQRRGN
jgi:predicted SnoaL-like aldol condensation-catalyzing enzyme